MRHIKALGSTAVAAAALMLFAAGASATSVSTSTGGSAATPTIHLVNENDHILIANPIALIECDVTIEGKIESHGSGSQASGNISTLNFTGCTNSYHLTSWSNGSISLSYTSGHNGTVTSSGMQFDSTRFGVTCVYETANTPMGTFTGGKPGTLHLEGYIPLNTGLSSFLCTGGQPTKAQWAGSFVTTSALYVAP